MRVCATRRKVWTLNQSLEKGNGVTAGLINDSPFGVSAVGSELITDIP